MKICQFVHYVMPLTMGIIGIGPISTPPCGSPYFGNAHSFEHYIIPINLGSFFCACAWCFKKHNTTQLILKSVMLALKALCFSKACIMPLKWPLSILYIFSHQVSHENFTLCKTHEGRYLLDQACYQIGEALILVKITP